ncbi:MAG TPA: DUF416 family protein [Gaiellaceae bacterium]
MTRFDTVIHGLADELEALSRPAQAAFFAACAHRLLPLYEQFADRAEWGDPRTVRAALAAAIRFALTGIQGDHGSLLASLDDAVPDVHLGVGSTEAQDVVICADAALHAASFSEGLDTSCVYYVFEPLLVALHESEPVPEVEDPGAEEEWYDAVVDAPPMSDALTFCFGAIALLRGHPIVPPQLFRQLERDAAALTPP